MAEAFCENSDPENANTVDHIDGNTLNNHADNLRWLSFADNMKEYSKRKRGQKNGNK
ncbi:HNH endonuclease [Ruminococcus sp. JL13D9]|uniref:HNH endonuclease n=1 Tax=Ruminococcus sp. JL13D9 TaxID=3233381 RepID=UPI00389B090B